MSKKRELFSIQFVFVVNPKYWQWGFIIENSKVLFSISCLCFSTQLLFSNAEELKKMGEDYKKHIDKL